MIVAQNSLWRIIVLILVGALVGWQVGDCTRSPRAEAQPAPDATTLSRTYVAEHAPNAPPAPTTRTVVTSRGDRITYRPAPSREPDFTARCTFYQPTARNNRPWLDAALGGGANDCRGQALKWGVLAGAVKRFGYGARVYFDEPFWQTFELRDTFGSPKPRDRVDVCCYWSEQFSYWTDVAEEYLRANPRKDDCLPVRAWLLREGE